MNGHLIYVYSEDDVIIDMIIHPLKQKEDDMQTCIVREEDDDCDVMVMNIIHI